MSRVATHPDDTSPNPFRATPKNADIVRQQLGNVTRLTFGRFRDESARKQGRVTLPTLVSTRTPSPQWAGSPPAPATFIEPFRVIRQSGGSSG